MYATPVDSSTLSGRIAASREFNSASAASYDSAAISSSTCSPHGRMRNAQTVCPSAARAARSVGEETRNNGARAPADEVSSRTEWLSAAVSAAVELKGYGRV